MIFIGEGGLLTLAVRYAISKGFAVDCVCYSPSDRSVLSLRNTGVSLIETHDANASLSRAIQKSSDGVVLSINNTHLFNDRALCSGASFFNIHNGLVQRYRGRPEICIFAALCNGERCYGVTLHKILPAQRVDSGPVVAQMEFSIDAEHAFSDLLTRSLALCHRILELNLEKILAGDFDVADVPHVGMAYTYGDVAGLCRQANPDNLRRASDFGNYASLFPRLKEIVESESRHRDPAA